jgi:hypothetical protein
MSDACADSPNTAEGFRIGAHNETGILVDCEGVQLRNFARNIDIGSYCKIIESHTPQAVGGS